MKIPLILGHRGVRPRGLRRIQSDLPAENSPAAFEFALTHGCDGFEFDVRRTRDGHAVLWHDPEWRGLPIADIDHADLADGSGNRLATLEGVLQEFGPRAFLDIEVKVTGLEAEVVRSLRATPPRSGVLVSSFFPWVLDAVRALDNALPLGYIFDRDEGLAVWRKLPIQVLLPQNDFITRQFVHEVHDSGRQVMAWTVNNHDRMLKLTEWGIDGIISDDPELLYQTFHSS